jgi:hypothetical protein
MGVTWGANMAQSWHAVAILMMGAAACGCRSALPVTLDTPGEQIISSEQFKLVSEPQSFVLHVSLPEHEEQVVIPRDWLIPPEQERAEEENYVTSFNYDSHVTSFAIGNGQIGLHISSYEAMTEGSAQAAAGRDVFLIYDLKASSVRKGLMDLGISKERIRMNGCASAKATHFLTADINGDGLTDLGVIGEELKCDVYDDVFPGPLYVQAPIRWYVFQPSIHPSNQNGWDLAGDYSGKLPKQYSELPLIGMTMSPVDYFAFRLWRSYDPSRWHFRSEPRKFVPTYRRKLIQGESKRPGQ